MLMSLGLDGRSVYEEDFENEFLKQSAEFFGIESQRVLGRNDASVYLQFVEGMIEEETFRAANYLDDSTGPRILEVLDAELISKQMKAVAEMEKSGVVHMLDNRNTDDLSSMQKLFGRVADGHKTIADCLSARLRAEGKAIVQVQIY